MHPARDLPRPRPARRTRAARPSCEGLEARALLSVGSALFHRFGAVEQPGQAASVPLPLGPDRLQSPPSGRTLVGIEVRPDEGSRLEPALVRISGGRGPAVVRPLPPSGTLLVGIRPGDYTLSVRGRGDSTGAFVATARLAGDADGDGDVQADDLAAIRRQSPGPAGALAAGQARRNLGAVNASPSITFQVANATAPKANPGGTPAYPNAQIFVAITGQDATTGQFVHVTRDGRAVPMALADNTATGHLSKDGINYSNYFVPLDQVASGWDVPYNLTGARLWVGLGSPLYFRVNTDAAGRIGYTTPDLGNPTDPNRALYWDHTEFATVNSGINANTTQVDQFGFPLKMTLKASGRSDQVVGLDASRKAILDAYRAEVPAAFQPLIAAQAPYRVIAPKHGVFSQANNPTYFDAYIDQVWTHYKATPWTFTNILGTFTGKVDPASDMLVLTKAGDSGGTTYRVQRPKTWEVFAAAGNMMSGNAVELAVEAQIVAGITRHVALANPAINVPPFLPSVVATFYGASPSNEYAHFWHLKGIGGLAYGFDYDDVYGQNPSVVAPRSASPRLRVDVGWD